METMLTCRQILSEAKEIAKHTIHNMFVDMDSDETMSHPDDEVLFHCVMVILEANKVLGETDK